MDNLLLLYVITLIAASFLGMSVVLRIIQSISFGSGYGYGGGGAIPHGAPGNNNRSGFSSTLIFLVIVAIIFWGLFMRSQESTTAEPAKIEHRQSTQEQEVKNTSPVDTYMVSSKTQIPSNRINQTPSHEGTVHAIYAIQVIALTSSSSAENTANEFYSHEPEIIYEDNLYKVVITGFPSRSAAKEYKKEYSIKGFVRTV